MRRKAGHKSAVPNDRKRSVEAAYHRFLERGRSHGYDIHDGLQAEAELASSCPKPATARELLHVLRNSGVIGLWKNRRDIRDSAAFARKLRQHGQTRK